MRARSPRPKLFATAAALALSAILHAQTTANWPITGGTPANTHYSSLHQINRTNVSKLREAWRFETGEASGLETTPIAIDGVLYTFTPHQAVIALDGATGKLIWKFDSGILGTGPDRGLTFWTDGTERRLLCAVMNFVYALNPATGKVIPTFGLNGRIDLREGLGRDPALQSIALTSPGVIYKDLYIVGGRTPETLPAPPGDIRAFDVRTGALRWSFHTIPHPGEPGYDTWPRDSFPRQGAANNWAGMAVDVEHGIVYAPTGSAVSDFYGGTRLGDNLFANTLLALDAATGKRVWHFQGVHHDIWDRDFPSAPILLSIRRNGKDIPAIGQTTKQGYFYFFNRLTGDPLFPIENHPYPPSTVPGEFAAGTQPLPLLPTPFAPQTVTEVTLTQRTPEAHAWAVNRLREIRHDGPYIPFSIGRDTLVSPSFEGGGEWGGPAFDPETGLVYVNANAYASLGALAVNQGGSPGRVAYLAQCSICHGDHRQGSAEFPTLLAITKKLSPAQIVTTIHDGKGRMPAMPVQGDALKDLLAYLGTDKDPLSTPSATEEQTPTVDLSQSLSGKGRVSDPATQTSIAARASAPEGPSPGARVYAAQCAICHGDRREGIAPSFPTLIGVGARYTDAQLVTLLHTGKGRMPTFDHRLSPSDTANLLRFLRPIPIAPPADLPQYTLTGYRRFIDPEGYPATATPWGNLSALDPRTGKYLWQIPLGQYPELVARGLPDTGSENYGGPVVTAGGLLFIAATNFDRKIRAFDKTTGKLLWESVLPFAGNATPAVYQVAGRQYLVIASGGGNIGTHGATGGTYVAFALPQ